MALKHIKPIKTNYRYKSERAHVFSMSDIHFGNTRPTNDCQSKSKSNLKKYFSHIKAYTIAQIKPLPTAENLHLLDIVFNGDTFDFWKAIPDPRPHSGGSQKTHDPNFTSSTPHNLPDYRQRFIEILDYNEVLIQFLAEVLYRAYRTEIPWGVDVYILTGNHDDPSSSQLFGAGPFKKLLCEKVIDYAIQSGADIVDPNQIGVYRQEIEKRIHWDHRQVYYNKKLMTYIEHGHRYDDENILRRDTVTNKIHPSAGQTLVESFLNGIHDRSLNVCIFEFERAYKLFPQLEKELPFFDNFINELHPIEYFKKISSSHKLVREALSKNAAIALYQMGDSTKANILFDNPVLAQILIFFKNIMKFNRSTMAKATHKAAKTILNRPDVRIVSMGHSHIFDTIPAQPVPSGQKLTKAYVNTATFVDLYKYKDSPPWKEEIKSPERPMLVHEKLIGSKRMAFVWIWDGTRETLWFRVDLP